MTDVLDRTETVTAALPRKGRGAGPDFICVGAQKAGTRWLYDQLAFHPQFWMPPVKELHYFNDESPGFRKANRLLRRIDGDLPALNRSREEDFAPPIAERDIRFVRNYVDLWEDKRSGIDGYADLFDEKGAQKTGDVTPAYSSLGEREIAAIVDRFPDIRVVFVAREPVERFWSALVMAARQVREKVSLPVTIESALQYLRRDSVSGRSFPSETVARWRKALPEDQFAWFFFDDLRSDPATLRARILRFLDADPALPSGGLEPGFNRKDSAEKLPLTDDVRDALVTEFADEIRRCADMLGGHAVAWRDKYNL